MKSHKKRINIVSVKMVKDKSFLYENRNISSPKEGALLVRKLFEQEDREKVIVVSVDTKNQPTNIDICSIGTLNQSIVHPREVFKTAILSNAASIIISHNHPSGNSQPSKEDFEITNRLKKAGEILGIDVLDHLIIGDDSYYSFKENNKL